MGRTVQFPHIMHGGTVCRPEPHRAPAASSSDDTESEDGGGDGSAYSSTGDVSDSDCNTGEYAEHAGTTMHEGSASPVPPNPRGACLLLRATLYIVLPGSCALLWGPQWSSANVGTEDGTWMLTIAGVPGPDLSAPIEEEVGPPRGK